MSEASTPAERSRERAKKTRSFRAQIADRLAADRAELGAMRAAGAKPHEIRQQQNLVDFEQMFMLQLLARAENLEANARGEV